MNITIFRDLPSYNTIPLLFISLILVISFVFILFILYKDFIGKKYRGAYFLPSTDKQLKAIIKFAGSDKSKVVADLGSGNGKILFGLAKQGFSVTGFEIDPALVFITKAGIYLNNLTRKACVFRKDFWQEDLSKFDIIILFGIGHMIADMETKLKKELKKGSKVISIRFSFPDLNLVKEENRVYLYEI